MDINQEFWEKEHEAELIAQAYEKNEFERLRLICPILQKTESINEAVAYCILCRQTHCLTTQEQKQL